ncbi:serine/threonine protein kinase [Actinocrinis puniceicyclus]|uniref:non-specific serine/threonine protein kinase n=1 Tax=Actinocrinis puniceicyclus TaxID=977794 RepID=A0A8J8BCA1_9ACTN|nr:serine/threonine-protein kinase [Actinocrinis puniceicyclus]MBS2962901.1 serine/threonine protein kinase [Actinocrinis puniceicyclus]
MEPAIPGTLLAERYQLVQPLGAGGSATVWEALDVARDRPVAVKLLRGAAVDDPTERERLRREARVLARLEHPRICAIRDYLEIPNADGSTQPVLVTEMLAGTSLARRLKEAALPWAEAVAVAAQVADALRAAHRAGVVHRDVKPANVMLVPDGAKLLDFGIARAAGDGDLTGNLTVGTPLCMAPEQVRGQRAKPASDIYALGCVLYWCLTGRPPYQSNDITEIFEAQLYDPPPPIEVPGLPARVVEFCHACLSKNPAFRPDATQALTTLSGIASAAGFPVGEPLGHTPRRSLAQFRPVAEHYPGESTMLAEAFDEPQHPAQHPAQHPEQYIEQRPAQRPGQDPVAPEAAYPGRADGSAAESAGAAPSRRARAGAAFDGRTRAAPAPKPDVPGADVPGPGEAGGRGRRRRSARPLLVGAVVGLSGAAALVLLLPSGHPGATAAQPPRLAAPPGSPPAGPAPSNGAVAPRMSGGSAPPISAAAAADPIRYLEAVRAQIRVFVADGPATLDPTTGGDLQNSIVDIENSVVSAQRNGGPAHLQEIRDKIARFDGRLDQLVGKERISRPAASQLTAEVQRLSGSVTD